jgi:hypothetical protein
MEDKKTQIINTLAKQVIGLTYDIRVGDIVYHKTDLDVETPYVVTDVVYNIETDEVYCECSNTVTQNIAYRVIELYKLNVGEEDDGTL